MNLEQVSHYIAHPHELSLGEAPALKELSEKHPYAAVFSLLYLTALANGKSVDLDAALQQHAYRLSDRTQLYHLIHNTEPASAVVADEPEALAEAPIITLQPETEEPQAEAAIVPVAETPAPIIELIPEEIPAEEPPTEEPEVEEPESTPEPEEEPEITASSFEEPISFDLITEAFTREQHFEMRPAGTEDVQEALEHETEPANDETPEPEEIQEETTPATAATEGRRSFTSWLKSAEPVTAPEPVSPEKKKVEAIIENFIKEEPSITRNKAEFFSPSKKAKESLDEDAVPVSETLAKIYAAQGNYPKAIHVYHQLMLSFPEKKSLFAVQIEALKKKITP